MNIAILGTGNMGKGLAAIFSKAGHRITLGDRDVVKARSVAAELGQQTTGAGLNDAAAAADVVILAVPYGAAAEAVAAAGGLARKTVIDITNPVTPDYSGLALGHTTSAAEEIQKAAPGAKIVKAFNTVFAQVLQAGGKAAGRPVTVFIAGDDPQARKTVADLAASAGLEPLETGGLSSARLLEPLGMLNITLGYGLGLGTDIAPTWQRNA